MNVQSIINSLLAWRQSGVVSLLRLSIMQLLTKHATLSAGDGVLLVVAILGTKMRILGSQEATTVTAGPQEVGVGETGDLMVVRRVATLVISWERYGCGERCVFAASCR